MSDKNQETVVDNLREQDAAEEHFNTVLREIEDARRRAQVRQEEINQLGNETRAVIAKLQAA